VDYRGFPKVELHRHLEGALRLQTIVDLAKEHGRELPAVTSEALAPYAQVLAPMNGLQAVLDAFDLFQHTFMSADAVERIAFEAVEDAHHDGIRLVELRFSPDFMARPSGMDWDVLMDALVRGIHRGEAATGVVVGLIAIVSRSYGLESAHQTASFAVNWREHLVGFDLADTENAVTAEDLARALAPIHRAGIPLTVHSGENTPSSHIRESVDILGARRIGHGVSLIFDQPLIEQCVREQIHIEACPTSNLRTRAVPTLADHPARRLLQQGVSLSLNSDDPGLFAITLSHELKVAQESLGFRLEDLQQATMNALDASFVEDAKKERVRQEITASWSRKEE
jgi:adenosine deaminase